MVVDGRRAGHEERDLPVVVCLWLITSRQQHIDARGGGQRPERGKRCTDGRRIPVPAESDRARALTARRARGRAPRNGAPVRARGGRNRPLEAQDALVAGERFFNGSELFASVIAAAGGDDDQPRDERKTSATRDHGAPFGQRRPQLRAQGAWAPFFWSRHPPGRCCGRLLQSHRLNHAVYHNPPVIEITICPCRMRMQVSRPVAALHN